MCALLIRGNGQNVPPCTSALGQWAVFGPGGSRACGFKAALPRQILRFCAILSNVAVRSYDCALRSSMAVVGGDAADIKKCITCFHHLCLPYRSFGKRQRTILSGTTCAVRVQSGVRSTNGFTSIDGCRASAMMRGLPYPLHRGQRIEAADGCQRDALRLPLTPHPLEA
jgi:hypothetical protein